MRSPLHITVIIMLGLVATFFLASERRETAYQEASSRYLAAALQDISRWETSALLRYLAPEARRTVTGQQLETLIARYRVLGEFERLSELELQRLSILSGWFGGPRLLGYRGEARFANGTAHLTATLKVDDDAGLSIYNLNFSSPLLETAPAAP
ncbi:MAG: hypothetical protein RBS88_03480 [Spongiibacteraceae bacterium]|nr:hypothetical protein [Spongiibacteraceae bacterium]